jgi:hypothetical protein
MENKISKQVKMWAKKNLWAEIEQLQEKMIEGAEEAIREIIKDEFGISHKRLSKLDVAVTARCILTQKTC